MRSDALQEANGFFFVGVEGVFQVELAVAFDVDGVPVDDVARALFGEKLGDDVAPAQGAGVLGRDGDGCLDLGGEASALCGKP